MAFPGSEPAPSNEELARAIDDLVDECRATALWFLRPDYHPRTDEERRSVLREVQKHGRLGRSWGCPALAPEVAQHVIEKIQGGTPVFAYYPDRKWLASSPFLGSCDAG